MNIKEFTRRLASIDWTMAVTDTYYKLYRDLREMVELLERARREPSGDSHSQKLYYDSIMAEREVQLDELKHRIAKEVREEIEREARGLILNLLDFGDQSTNTYMEIMLDFNWVKYQNPEYEDGKLTYVRRFISESDPIIRRHWNRQCELHNVEHLKWDYVPFVADLVMTRMNPPCNL